MNNMNYKDTLTYQVAMHDFNKLCEIGYSGVIKKLMKDPLIKKIVKELNEKEVKKMKYFETKVVKVKKEKYTNPLNPMCTNKDVCKRCIIHQHCLKQKKMYEPKGNWVNGENLDKIKFPCFCSYILSGKKCYGKLDMYWDDIAYKNGYQISRICNQTNGVTVLHTNYSLKTLIINLKIKIVPGKIIIYENERKEE